MLFLEMGRQDQKKRDPKGIKRGPLGANQCACCKEEGHWRKECLKFKRDSTDENAHQEMPKGQCKSDDERGGPVAPLNLS